MAVRYRHDSGRCSSIAAIAAGASARPAAPLDQRDHRDEPTWIVTRARRSRVDTPSQQRQGPEDRALPGMRRAVELLSGADRAGLCAGRHTGRSGCLPAGRAYFHQRNSPGCVARRRAQFSGILQRGKLVAKRWGRRMRAKSSVARAAKPFNRLCRWSRTSCRCPGSWRRSARLRPPPPGCQRLEAHRRFRSAPLWCRPVCLAQVCDGGEGSGIRHRNRHKGRKIMRMSFFLNAWRVFAGDI